MPDLNFVTAVGLIGITLVIAVGSIFNGLREWLKSFTFWGNPLRWAGLAMSCTMCAGVHVGFVWGLYTHLSIGASLVIGGFVSVASYFADESLSIISAVAIRIIRRQPAPAPVRVPLPRAPLVPDEEASITEEDANDILDAAEDNA